MSWLRTQLFRVVFYSGSVVIVLLAPIAALFGQAWAIRWSRLWFAYHRWATRLILGIRTRVEGEQPVGPVLYAAKHEAMYETLELTLLLDRPAVVMKRELARIPVWGWVTRQYGVIPVDREASAGALRRMMVDARAARESGRPVLIFPEGTRVLPGEAPPLRSGFAGLYRALDLPVVPVALDSGRLLPKRGTMHPGTVTIRLGEPIPPRLPRGEIEARVHAAINALQADV